MASDRLLPFVTTVVIAANAVVTTRKNDISHVIAVSKRVYSESDAGDHCGQPALCCSDPWVYLRRAAAAETGLNDSKALTKRIIALWAGNQ